MDKNILCGCHNVTLEDVKKHIESGVNSFKDLQGKGNLDYRSYQNGYLNSFSKYVVSKIK